jgi:hypothetical protein
MNNIYFKLRNLAKSIRYQNLFTTCKELHTIRLFKNSMNLSNIQNIFLSHLYNYDSINRDIIVENISKHVLDEYIYTDAYLLWKQKNINKKTIKDNKQKEINLVVGREINFPTKEK